MTEQENQPQVQESAKSDVVDSVRDLIDMMKSGGIGELELKSEEFKLHLRTEAVALAANSPAVSMNSAPAGNWAPYPSPAPAHEAAPAPATSEEVEPAQAPVKEGHVVSSPMIGTFYSASAPGEPAFVQVGDDVETGQTIGIIEAMKIMNEISADKSGVVVEILVENAEAVEYGTPLVRISNSARLD